MSTVLDTAAKVKALYGGTWRAWGAGRVPVAVDTSDTDFNEAGKTGGSKTVTLPLDEHGSANLRTYGSVTFQGRLGDTGAMPRDTAINKYYAFNHNGDYQSEPKDGWDGKRGIGLSGTTGSGNIMNPYKTLYMWERTA